MPAKHSIGAKEIPEARQGSLQVALPEPPPFSVETHNVTAYTALLKDAYAKTDAAEKMSYDSSRAGDKRGADFYSNAAKHAYDRVEVARSLITTVRAANIDEAAVHAAVLFGMFDCIMDQVPSEAETASFKREKAAIERLIFSLMDFLESQSTRPLSAQVNDYFGSPWCNPWQATCPALIEVSK